ncbi:hypothetical protein GQX74_005895 [Glossina fuscipes]|nr:hypothetical protein GQX74_005895 [Glossina fuscipes]
MKVNYLQYRVRRTVQIDRVNHFVKRIQEDSSGVSLDELNRRLKALDSAFDAFNKIQTKIEEKGFNEILNQIDQNVKNYITIIHANAADLRELIDTMNNHLIGLKNINRPVESWDDLMVYIITSKLDPDTLNKWNEKAPIDRLPTLSELLNFFKGRFLLSSVPLPGGAPTNRAIEPKRVQRTAKSFVTIKNCCSFCQKPGHVIYRCSDFLSLSAADRLNKVHALKLCVNCLKFKKHNISDCTSKGRCHTCGKGHHSLLDFERPQVAIYTASKHKQINETNHIELAENTNHNMSDQAQPKNFAALKTPRTKYTSYSNCLYYIEIQPMLSLSCSIGWWFTN